MATLKIKNMVIGEGMPKIIVPLVGKTEEDLLIEAAYVKELGPDAIEWRVDCFEHVENLEAVKAVLAKLRFIFKQELLLFTFRSHTEGGNKEISEDFYIQLNETAIRTKQIDLVDIELFQQKETIKALVTAANENGVFVVMSNHDFTKTPAKEEIITRLCSMQNLGAHILKMAVMPKSAGDVLTLLNATYTMKTEHTNRPLIMMAMAGTGLISRLAGEIFGSAFTFAAGKESSAPGQMPIEELRPILESLHKRL